MLVEEVQVQAHRLDRQLLMQPEATVEMEPMAPVVVLAVLVMLKPEATVLLPVLVVEEVQHQHWQMVVAVGMVPLVLIWIAQRLVPVVVVELVEKTLPS